MRRRDVLGLAAISAAARVGLGTHPLVAEQKPLWRRDGAGLIARIGVLTPDFDPVPESEIWAMAPDGVSIHASRIRWNREAKKPADPLAAELAAEALAGLDPQAVIYAFTTSSYQMGSSEDEPFRQRLAARAKGAPVVLTAPDAVAALQVLSATRIALIHPPWFSDEVHSKGESYFRSRGFELAHSSRVAPARSFTEVAPSDVYEWVTRSVPASAQAVLIAGNGLRAVGTIAPLEEALSRPVLTANQVTFWAALRAANIKPLIRDYGTIFTRL